MTTVLPSSSSSSYSVKGMPANISSNIRSSNEVIYMPNTVIYKLTQQMFGDNLPERFSKGVPHTFVLNYLNSLINMINTDDSFNKGHIEVDSQGHKYFKLNIQEIINHNNDLQVYEEPYTVDTETKKGGRKISKQEIEGLAKLLALNVFTMKEDTTRINKGYIPYLFNVPTQSDILLKDPLLMKGGLMASLSSPLLRYSPAVSLTKDEKVNQLYNIVDMVTPLKAGIESLSTQLGRYNKVLTEHTKDQITKAVAATEVLQKKLIRIKLDLDDILFASKNNGNLTPANIELFDPSGNYEGLNTKESKNLVTAYQQLQRQYTGNLGTLQEAFVKLINFVNKLDDERKGKVNVPQQQIPMLM